jgi:hypothetical protein
VYAFKPEPHDRQWSRDEVTRADKWPDTPIRTDRTRTRLLINAHSRCWAPWPDALAWRTRRTTTWHSVEYRELPERVFVDRTRPNITDRMHHSVRLSSRASLLHWVLTSHRPDASVPWPTGHAGARPASTRGRPPCPVAQKISTTASTRWRERGSQTYLYRLNSTSFANVLTSPSIHHHVHVC